MADRDVVLKEKVSYSGIFSFQELYNFLLQYLRDMGYFVREIKNYEENKKEGKEIFIEWDAQKKISDYFRYKITVKFNANIKKIKVKKNGKVEEANRGKVGVSFSSVLIYDYEGKWKGYPWKLLRGIYDYFIIRDRVGYYKDKLKREVKEMNQQVKSFLAMEKSH